MSVSTQHIQQVVAELKRLKRLGASGRKRFFKKCGKESVIRICECIRNLLKANIPVKSTHLKKLSRHKQTLRQLALKHTSLKTRKRLLQKGGFLGALIPAIVPALASLLGGIFNRG
jgi:hypothetical protein